MGMFDDLTPENKSKGGLFDDLVPLPPKVERYREGLRKARDEDALGIPGTAALHNATTASRGLLGSLGNEVNSAALAGIDTLTGDAPSFNERRKQYRQVLQEDSKASKEAVGGMAIPLEMAAGMGYAGAMPIVGKLPSPVPASPGMVNGMVAGTKNLVSAAPTMAKTGAFYGGLNGLMASEGDDIKSRLEEGGREALGGAVMGPLIHAGITTAGGAIRGARGAVRGMAEKFTGTTPAERAAMANRRAELNAAGVKDSEIYGPLLRDEPSPLESYVQSSLGGYYPTKKASDRHLNAISREADSVIRDTGAPRTRQGAAEEAQNTIRHQLQGRNVSAGDWRGVAEDELLSAMRPIAGDMPAAPPPNMGGRGGPKPPPRSPKGPTPQPTSPAGGGAVAEPPMPDVRGRDIANAYQNARQIRYEKKLPHPDDYFTSEEATALADMWEFAGKKIAKPEGLANWIIRNGGIRDTGGDVAHMLGKANMRPGLINNKTGMHPDDLTRKAWEEGFIVENERPEINTLLDHLHRDLRGDTVVRSHDYHVMDDLLLQEQFRQELAQHGITGKTAQDLWKQLRAPQRRSDPRPAASPAETIEPRMPEPAPVPKREPQYRVTSPEEFTQLPGHLRNGIAKAEAEHASLSKIVPEIDASIERLHSDARFFPKDRPYTQADHEGVQAYNARIRADREWVANLERTNPDHPELPRYKAALVDNEVPLPSPEVIRVQNELVARKADAVKRLDEALRQQNALRAEAHDYATRAATEAHARRMAETELAERQAQGLPLNPEHPLAKDPWRYPNGRRAEVGEDVVGPAPRAVRPVHPREPLTENGQAGGPPLFPPKPPVPAEPAGGLPGPRRMAEPEQPALPKPEGQQALPPPEMPEPPPIRGEGPSLTDKDRISAGYEYARRMVPGEADGGGGTARLPHRGEKGFAGDTNVNALIEEIRKEARARGQIVPIDPKTGKRANPGVRDALRDDPKVPYWQSPVKDQIEREVRKRGIPKELADSLFAPNSFEYHPSVSQFRDYRSMVRNADSSEPETRTLMQRWLPRFEEAMTKDLHARLKYIKDPRAFEAFTKMDAAYGAWKGNAVKNLASVTRENITPETAFNGLMKSLEGKNYGLLRQYIAANQRAGNAQDGVGVLVAHMMEGQTSRSALESFVKSWSKVTPGAKAIMANGEGQALVQSLDRLNSLAAPALKKSQTQSIGLGWKSHGVIGLATLLNHHFAAAFAVGGQYAVGRILARPQYVNWLTRAATIQNNPSMRHLWANHVARLYALTDDDRETGRQILEAWVPGTARAEVEEPEKPAMRGPALRGPVRGMAEPPAMVMH